MTHKFKEFVKMTDVAEVVQKINIPIMNEVKNTNKSEEELKN